LLCPNPFPTILLQVHPNLTIEKKGLILVR
jgi:hypothetical protein